jgi:hypothetical protein
MAPRLKLIIIFGRNIWYVSITQNSRGWEQVNVSPFLLTPMSHAVFKIYFNIILPSSYLHLASSLFPSGSSAKNFVCISDLSYAIHATFIIISINLITEINFPRRSR